MRVIVTILVMMVLFSSNVYVQPITVQSLNLVEKWPTEGWVTSTPEEQGMNSSDLSAIYDDVRNSDADICSMLVVRHGYIVAEEYFMPEVFDMNPDT